MAKIAMLAERHSAGSQQSTSFSRRSKDSAPTAAAAQPRPDKEMPMMTGIMVFPVATVSIRVESI